VHTPRFWGEPFSAGVFGFSLSNFLGILTNWLTVGN
jgi:hypothetical protein